MGWFTKKSQQEECPHGNNGPCPRCLIGSFEDDPEYIALNEDFVLNCMVSIDPLLNILMREYSKNLVIAGGFIRDAFLNVTPKDIDIFCNKPEIYKRVIENPPVDSPKVYTVSNNTEVAALRYLPQVPRQVSNRFKFTDPIELISQFDYTICQAAIWYNKSEKKWTGICHRSWELDVALRRLVFTDKTPELSALGRLLHFTQAGYSIDSLNLSRVITSVVSSLDACDEVDLDKVEEQLFKGIEMLKKAKQPEVESAPFRKPKAKPRKRYYTDWGGS